MSLSASADMKVTQKSFNFARKFSLPFYFVSAADGTNVVKVRLEFDCWTWCPGGPLAAQGHRRGCCGHREQETVRQFSSM